MTIPDKILISGLDAVATIGVSPEERAMKQRLAIDVEFATDARAAAGSDSLGDAIDYSRVARAVAEVCQERDYHLIETVAEKIAARILQDFPTSGVRLVVRKISPVSAPKVAHVSVEIVRP